MATLEPATASALCCATWLPPSRGLQPAHESATLPAGWTHQLRAAGASLRTSRRTDVTGL